MAKAIGELYRSAEELNPGKFVGNWPMSVCYCLATTEIQSGDCSNSHTDVKYNGGETCYGADTVEAVIFFCIFLHSIWLIYLILTNIKRALSERVSDRSA